MQRLLATYFIREAMPHSRHVVQFREMNFELVGDLMRAETIAVGASIREHQRLRRAYGGGRWRKRTEVARVRLEDGTTLHAEVHWYEAHSVGRVEMRIKRFLSGTS